MKKIILFIFTLAVLFSCGHVKNKLVLPALISKGMVLQRNSEVKLWGESSPGAKITVTASWGTKADGKTDGNGKWMVTLKTGDAGGPYDVGIQAGDTSVVIKDVLLGEVWLCSGQSNMEMPMQGWPPTALVNNSASEIARANNPNIRLFTVGRNISLTPVDTCHGSWKDCTPENVAPFSATAYFFGRKLQKELGVPVGLIHSSWGGTPAESWTSPEYISKVHGYENITAQIDSVKIQYQRRMAWLETLKYIPIGQNENFYANLDLKDEKYDSADYDDSAWPTMKLPSYWESESLPGFDGFVWFRKDVNIPSSEAGKDLILHLGAVDDMDATYFNGVKIGSILKGGFWQVPRNYPIPGSLVKRGKNVIAVKVIDTQGGGGIYDPLGISLQGERRKSFVVNLNGEWKYKPEAEIVGNNIYIFGTGNKSFEKRPEMNIELNASTPTVLYNAMIYPLEPYTIKGVIWYQGESNVGRGYQYRTLFPTLIASWRNAWAQGDFPFYYVQIAPYNYGEKVRSNAAEIREAQLMAMSLPNTGMVVTTDIGNPDNIHPGDKQDVGKRLALWALAKNYGKDSLVYSGPIYKSSSTEGNKITISFDYVDGGLVAKGGKLKGFEIAGADSVYHPAIAQIVSDKVVVSSPKVKKPIAVRFGWSQTPATNLFNTAGLPASPFRTAALKILSPH